jgi:hypothetical protein
MDFDFGIDIWSAGCVATKLFLGLALFHAQSQDHMLAMIDDMLGPFPMAMPHPQLLLFAAPLLDVLDFDSVLAGCAMEVKDVSHGIGAVLVGPEAVRAADVHPRPDWRRQRECSPAFRRRNSQT